MELFIFLYLMGFMENGKFYITVNKINIFLDEIVISK